MKEFFNSHGTMAFINTAIFVVIVVLLSDSVDNFTVSALLYIIYLLVFATIKLRAIEKKLTELEKE